MIRVRLTAEETETVVRIFTLILMLSVPAGQAQDPKPTDRERIQGGWIWEPTAKQSDAKPVVLVERVVIDGDNLTIHYSFGGKNFPSPCKFKLNPHVEPRELEFTPTQGSNKGKAYFGIYEFKDGQLRIAYRGPGASRPKSFDDKHDPKTNDVTSFLVLKRPPGA